MENKNTLSVVLTIVFAIIIFILIVKPNNNKTERVVQRETETIQKYNYKESETYYQTLETEPPIKTDNFVSEYVEEYYNYCTTALSLIEERMSYNNITASDIYLIKDDIIALKIYMPMLDLFYDESSNTLSLSHEKIVKDINIDKESYKDWITLVMTDKTARRASDLVKEYCDKNAYSLIHVCAKLQEDGYGEDMYIPASLYSKIDYYDNAFRRGYAYYSQLNFTKDMLIDRLKEEWFTNDQIEYAVNLIY